MNPTFTQLGLCRVEVLNLQKGIETPEPRKGQRREAVKTHRFGAMIWTVMTSSVTAADTHRPRVPLPGLPYSR